MEVHHIIFRTNGGSDEESNLITLCKTCHNKVHKDKIKLKKIGKVKGQLKHATQMNSIRIQLLKQVDCEETFGFITKEHRQLMGLPKEHYYDAVAIASLNNIKENGLISVDLKIKNILFKKCVADGDYRQTRGIRSEQRIPTGKIQGFRKFDKVRYLGRGYFIKGRMSTGFAFLMDSEGNKIDFSNFPKGMKTPKMKSMLRINARKSWIIDSKPIQFIS